MIRRIALLLLWLPLVATGKNDVTIESLPPHAAMGGQGVAAAFCGQVNNRLLLAGGCNFPDTPAAEGGKKHYYESIWDLGENGWHKKQFALPTPVAYGAYVSQGNDAIICIGGTDGTRSMKNVYQLTDKKVNTLPNLPVGIDNAAAASHGTDIYVVGGHSDGHAQMGVYHYSLSSHLTTGSSEWELIATLPGQPRLQPAAVVQGNGLDQVLYVFGGYDPGTGKIAETIAALNLKTMTWSNIPDSRATVGMTAATSGYSHILLFGGVNKVVFEKAVQGDFGEEYMKHPAEWYQFNPDILVYHTITDSWFTLPGNSLLARAGAGLAKVDDGYVLVNGESKPGIRATEVIKVTFQNVKNFGWLNWIVLVFYLLSMLGLGFYFMHRESGSDDFFKGGGRIPWWAAGISIFATMLSAITYMSIPAKAYATDWTYYPMQICILIVSFPVIRYYLPFFVRLKVTTAYEYLEKRFNYATRLMASVLFIVFMVARTALVIFLPSLALTAVTGINIYLCIVLMALITIIYCTMGGVEAVVWGDVIQGIILVGGAILAAGYLIANTGEHGASDFWQIATDNDKFRMFVWSLDWKTATFWVVILGGLGNNLISYTSDQTVIQRYMTTSDEKSAARGIMTNGLMSVIVTIAFFTIGTGLYTFFKTHPAELDFTMAKGDAIFPFFMMSQMPQGLAGLLIAAVFAATMSTIASNINSISTAFTVDLWSRFRETSDKGKVKTARIAGVCAGLIGMGIAILMAMVDIQSLLDYFNTILGLLSGAIGGLFMMGIFFPRIGSRAALIGFICGTATVFYMNFMTQVNFLLFGFTSMAVSVIVAWLWSMFDPNKKEVVNV